MSSDGDPPRLARSSGVPPALSRALGAARARLPSDTVLSEVAARLPVGPVGPGGGHGPGGGGALGSGAPPIATSAPVWSGLLLGATLGAVVGSLSLLVPLSAPAPQVSVAVPAPTRVPPELAAPAAPETIREDEKAIAPSPPVDGTPVLQGRDPQAPAAPESETDYLRRAHARMSASPGQALALAQAHAQKYPDGKLGQEREMIVIGALVALGRKAEARARASVFVGLFPDSAYRRRIEVLVPDLPAPEKKSEP